MNIVDYGLYKVKDEYFEHFKSSYFTDNKSENRPYYLSFKDKDNIIWLIPLSSQTVNYQLKISQDIENRGEYTYSKIHYVVQDKKTIKEVSKRAKKFLTLVTYGKLKPYVDILSIKKELLNNKKSLVTV